MGAQRAAAPVLSGVVPPLADSYFPRVETGFGLVDVLRPGETIVLASAEDSGAPGVGKTQLAVGFAHAVWNNRAVDLLVWVLHVLHNAPAGGLSLDSGARPVGVEIHFDKLDRWTRIELVHPGA